MLMFQKACDPTILLGRQYGSSLQLEVAAMPAGPGPEPDQPENHSPAAVSLAVNESPSETPTGRPIPSQCGPPASASDSESALANQTSAILCTILVNILQY